MFMYPKEVTDTFGIHVRYIKIHVSCALVLAPWCHLGYISGYVYPRLFITIHQDTPRCKITIHVSWTGYMRDTI